MLREIEFVYSPLADISLQRFLDHKLCECDALLFASRKSIDLCVQFIREPDPLDRLFDAHLAAVFLPYKFKVLPDGLVLDEGKVLKKEPYLASEIFKLIAALADVDAVNEYCSAGELFKPADHIEQSCLAAAGGSGEDNELAVG